MVAMYYNTNNATGKELEKAQKVTSQQDIDVIEIISKYNKLNPHVMLTPRRVWALYRNWKGKHIMLTSVRRSISDLVKKGILKYGDKINIKCPIDGFPTKERVVIAV